MKNLEKCKSFKVIGKIKNPKALRKTFGRVKNLKKKKSGEK